MTLVRPKQAFVCETLGYPVTLGPADILDDAHQIVRQFPDLFEPVTRNWPPVEQTTAAPGEKRSTQRRGE